MKQTKEMLSIFVISAVITLFTGFYTGYWYPDTSKQTNMLDIAKMERSGGVFYDR